MIVVFVVAVAVVVVVVVAAVTPNVEVNAPVGLPRCLFSSIYNVSTYPKLCSAVGGDNGWSKAGSSSYAS